ncbi:uncharacterized protein B0J16DRAFT_312194 [Fusarium flagelliforme]|uniref:uncharacterized protein n=1 Tax=Fusarium flagelliforme TaxID=2675880 RepID=UPI001E8E0B82|nr:uncharacterized protein B0J16DRAFT_312194 [Fusarium flagelliforme]KAH7173997.1 hypothetical protein B0J16DRAFT_312194 [Fusarium flagelliforme]
MLLQLPIISTLLSLVSASKIGSYNNITVQFFTADQDCDKDTKAPILTTRDTPTDLVCFNLTDTFSPGNKTISGIQKAYRPWEDRNSNVSYYLEQNDFDSSANYTQIRYALPGMEPGEEKAQWVLWTYPHLNCETVVKDVDPVKFPWYEGDGCKTWAQLGSATKIAGQLSRAFYATVAVAVVFMIL